jgi:hypothetical protein
MASLTNLSLGRNDLTGTLPQTLEMPNLFGLDLHCNQFSGKLPSSWIRLLPAIEIIDMSCQAGDGFSGTMPPSWRRWCATTPAHSDFFDFIWCISWEVCTSRCAIGNDAIEDVDASRYSNEDSCILPKGLRDTKLPSNNTFWQGLRWSWREDGCRYPFAYEALVSLMVVMPVCLICMLIVGIGLRRVARKRSLSAGQSSSSTPTPSWLSNVWRYGTIAVSMARPILVCVDVVTDAVAIWEVWGTWVGYVLLGVVFLPNLVTATVLAICMFKCHSTLTPRKIKMETDDILNQVARGFAVGSHTGAAATHDGNRVISKLHILATKSLLWAAKPLLVFDGFMVWVCSLHASLVWRLCCTVTMWPVFLVAVIPMLLVYSGICKSSLTDASGPRVYAVPSRERVYSL